MLPYPYAKADCALIDPATIRDRLIEAIIEVDDAVTERYFEGTLPSREYLGRLIVEAFAAGSLIPIVSVSAKTGVGLPELLDALAYCALPPNKVVRKATTESGQEVTLKAEASAPLVA